MYYLRDDFTPVAGLVPGTWDYSMAMVPYLDVSAECRIPFQHSQADVLFIAGQDDHNFKSAQNGRTARLVERLGGDLHPFNYNECNFFSISFFQDLCARQLARITSP